MNYFKIIFYVSFLLCSFSFFQLKWKSSHWKNLSPWLYFYKIILTFKKIRRRSKIFKIHLNAFENRGLKIMKFYIYINLERESNQNNVLKIFFHIFWIESIRLIVLKLYFECHFWYVHFHFSIQKWKSSHQKFWNFLGTLSLLL